MSDGMKRHARFARWFGILATSKDLKHTAFIVEQTVQLQLQTLLHGQATKLGCLAAKILARTLANDHWHCGYDGVATYREPPAGMG
jgi:hypothetical protein